MAQVLLDEPQIDSGFEQVRGPRVAKSVHRGSLVVAAFFKRRAGNASCTLLRAIGSVEVANGTSP